MKNKTGRMLYLYGQLLRGALDRLSETLDHSSDTTIHRPIRVSMERFHKTDVGCFGFLCRDDGHFEMREVTEKELQGILLELDNIIRTLEGS